MANRNCHIFLYSVFEFVVEELFVSKFSTNENEVYMTAPLKIVKKVTKKVRKLQLA